MPAKHIDPELLRQLGEAGEAPVGAVFHLRPGPTQTYLSAEETEAGTKRLLKRVEQESGLGPQRTHVFRNLGSFVVSAPAAFVRMLLDQEEVLSATANRQSEDLLIKPVASKPVKGSGSQKKK